jgi:hypothetical protein
MSSSLALYLLLCPPQWMSWRMSRWLALDSLTRIRNTTFEALCRQSSQLVQAISRWFLALLVLLGFLVEIAKANIGAMKPAAPALEILNI